MTAVAQFIAAFEAAGIVPPDTIIADGKIHRFGASGKSCWYVLHLDGIPAGTFGDWKTSHSETWSAKSSSDMTVSERQAMRARVELVQRQRVDEQRQQNCNAAANALAIWNECELVKTHAYLIRKGIASHGVRTDGHHLCIPLRDTDGALHSLQTISPDGTKRFLPGGRVRGCYFAIGKPALTIVIGEGFATCATVHEATGHAVAVAFNAGGLMPVAIALREKYPKMAIIVAADDDWQTPGNPGMKAAREAAQRVSGKLAVPIFNGLVRGVKDTDFNDLHRLAAGAAT